MPKLTKLSKAVVAAEAFAASPQEVRVIRDSATPGFHLIVGVRSKSFVLQKDIWRDGKRKTLRRVLGQWHADGRGISVEEARRAAIDLIAQISNKIDPREAAKQEAQTEPERGMTLREAVVLFAKSKGKGGKVRAEKTQNRYQQFFEAGYLSEWMNRSLASITRKEVYERHQALPAEIVAGRYATKRVGERRLPERQTGHVTADGVFRWFRAVYRRAMKLDETLPADPCVALEWFNVKAERTAIPTAMLAKWHAGVQAIPNRVRRDYLLFVLFSGMRRKSASEMRWADVDFERRVLRVPKPKGGEERAFDLPLSDYLVALLRERQSDNPELVKQQVVPTDVAEWVWPAYGASGHIEEPREEIAGVPFSIHDLRRTFITVAESLDLSPFVIGALVNHRQPGGSVTAGYINMETERLRAPMQAIANRLLNIIGGGATVVPLQKSRRQK